MGLIKGREIVFNVDEKYTDIYNYFTKKNDGIDGIDTGTLFLLSAAIGFKNSRKSKLIKKDKQTRGSFLIPDEESLIYNMAYSDEVFNGNLEKLASDDKETINEIKNLYEEYANGGMEILVENVFKDHWDGIELERSYEKHHYDLSRFIASEIKNVPF